LNRYQPMSKLLFCLLFFIVVLTPARGEYNALIEASVIDSSNIKPRQINSDFFTAYRTNPDFDYSSALARPAPTLWESIARWLIHRFRLSAGYYKTLSFLFKVFFWLLIAGILIFAFSRFKFYKYFYTAADPPPKEFTVEDMDENVEDLNAAIQREFRNKNYRLALRYQFIKVLRELDENGMISYATEKTNIDYLSEIKSKSAAVSPVFELLINTYNAVWYGHYAISKADYNRYSGSFVQLNSLLYAKD